MRAFMNGRMDLAQAEAVADLIHAENKTMHDVALRQLKGASPTKSPPSEKNWCISFYDRVRIRF